MAEMKRTNKFYQNIASNRYETGEIAKYRKQLLQNATGEILELSIGTGVNLAYYPNPVRRITGVDESMKMLRSERPKVDHYYSKLKQLPFEENTFDTVVATFSLYRIVELDEVLTEIKRVLKPRGRLIFLEHGQAKKTFDRVLQDIVNPLYEIFGNRVINRDYFSILKTHDFLLVNPVDREVMISPKRLYGTIYMGIALNAK